MSLKEIDHSKSSGQLLIEASIAMTVLIVSLTGIFSLTSQALALNRIALEQYIGASLAQEGIEIVKNLIDQNSLQNLDCHCIAWKEGLDPSDPDDPSLFYQADFRSVSLGAQTNTLKFFRVAPRYGVYFYDDLEYCDPDGFGCVDTNETKFTRRIEIGEDTTSLPQPQNRDDKIIVHSIVEWTNRGGEKKQAHIEAHYFNWQQF
jgi:Tfp pilus assembly protein PilV